MDRSRITYLHALYLENRLNSLELQEWKAMLDDESLQAEIGRLMDAHFEQLVQAPVEPMPVERSQVVMASIMEVQRPKVIRLWPRIAVAASIIGLICAGLFFYYNHPDAGKDQLAFQQDVAPGKNGATLTLGNGKKIYINDALAGNIAEESGVKISKNKDGQLIYEVTGNADKVLTYNTLSTTRGEQSQVRLPDGSLVFLNSESSLTYPTRFAGSAKRSVSLTGEGFFQVSKDKKHPFIVKTTGQEVEVLGTEFNINSYASQAGVKTTLLEGSVKVTTAANVSKILSPDQQATVSAAGIRVEDVEAQFSVDWKEGFFMFDNESLESITGRLARWYNVKVVFEDTSLKKVTAIGTVSKFDKLSKVVEVLEQGRLAKFKLEGGTLTISKRN